MENLHFLTAAALIALSVTALETELSAADYPVDVLSEAIALEQAKAEPRKTAIEALSAAKALAEAEASTAAKALADLAAATVKEEENKLTEDGAGLTVVAGKAITTKRGILSGGDAIRAEDLSGGTEALLALHKSGHIA